MKAFFARAYLSNYGFGVGVGFFLAATMFFTVWFLIPTAIFFIVSATYYPDYIEWKYAHPKEPFPRSRRFG